MIKFISELIEKIQEKEAIHNFKLDNELLAKKTNIKGGVFESEFRTYYHLTPYDLGKEAVLEPRISNGVESVFYYAGIIKEVRNFKCVSFGYNVSGCLVQLPAKKLKEHKEFYIYRTKIPISGFSEYVINNNEKTIYEEIRVFKKIEVIRVGKVSTTNDIYEKIQKAYELEEKENRKPRIEILKYIEVKPESKTVFILV